MDEVLLGVGAPPEGWSPCVCGSTTWPHDCVWAGLKTRLLDLPDEVVVAARSGVRLPVLPPCPVCGRKDWPVGGMHAARTMHMRAHERKRRGVVS